MLSRSKSIISIPKMYVILIFGERWALYLWVRQTNCYISWSTFFAILKRSPANKISLCLIDWQSYIKPGYITHKSFCLFRPLKSPSKVSFMPFFLLLLNLEFESNAKIELGAALVSKRKLSTINFENWPQTANYAEVTKRRRRKTWQMSLWLTWVDCKHISRIMEIEIQLRDMQSNSIVEI